MTQSGGTGTMTTRHKIPLYTFRPTLLKKVVSLQNLHLAQNSDHKSPRPVLCCVGASSLFNRQIQSVLYTSMAIITTRLHTHPAPTNKPSSALRPHTTQLNPREEKENLDVPGTSQAPPADRKSSLQPGSSTSCSSSLQLHT